MTAASATWHIRRKGAPRLAGWLAALAMAAGPALATGADATVPAPPQAAAKAPLPEPTLARLRGPQLWLDELPDTLDPAEVEIVILSPDSRCRAPLRKGTFGLMFDPVDPMDRALCKRIDGFVAAPPDPLPIAVRVLTSEAPSRVPAEVLAAVEPAPQRRYVALVHWDWTQQNRDISWLFEVVVLDRNNGRAVWHGAKPQQLVTGKDYEERWQVAALRALLGHELPRDLLRRGWWRDALPVPGSRWITLEETPTWRPATDRAGLAIVNTYYSGQPLLDQALLKLWPAGTPEVDDSERLRRAGWGAGSTASRPQSTPWLAPDTYILLELPPGDYTARIYTDTEPLKLAPGRITVVNIQRGFSNAKTLSIDTEDWWRRKILGERGRHAFLPEPAGRGWPALVPYFVVGDR